MEKQVIIIFGPPGAGKGTQSELLSEKLGFYHLESSKVLERCFKSEDPKKNFNVDGKDYNIGEEIENWKKGILTSPPFVTFLMMKEFKKLAEQGESFILSGSPRTIYEVEKETPVLLELFGKENIKIFLIEISAEVTIFRNTHRKICELMRHPILFNDETKDLKLCPLDGSNLVKRESLDDPETIKTRLVQYRERTLPMLDYFEKNGFDVKKINGEKYVSQVHEEILKWLQ
jgi:adenylate kinase